MILGIDASNIRDGGGVTHLMELLGAVQELSHGFERVVVWASRSTLGRIEDRPWLYKRTDRLLEGHYIHRVWWQRNSLGKALRVEGCDLLFVPGGTIVTNFQPVVTMSRNLLPFEWRELRRYSRRPMALRLMLIRWAQSRSFRKASGVIFLTFCAQASVLKVAGRLNGRTAIIPHGIGGEFFQQPRPQRPLAEYSAQRPLRLVYISTVDFYKHQWYVAGAVAKLRREGLPVVLDLIGPAYPPALRRLRRALYRVDSTGEFIRYLGRVPYKELPSHYQAADIYVFASSCENLPNVLLEAMASGVPIASSNKGPMSEVLASAGVYFDPEKPTSIADSLRQLIEDPELRTRKAWASYERARRYSWRRCADETLGFLADVAADEHCAPRSAT